MNKHSRQTKKQEKMTKKGSLDKFKCLSKINLDDASRGEPFPSIMPKKFLHEINVISHIPVSEKSILSKADCILKSLGHPSCNNLIYHFVYDIAARDWTKIYYSSDIS